ncbi:hypothetical protein C2855_08445 [Aeromonas bestiarum]|nr:hypothetical protein C2855_08445 [Aeromonas bestiarum]
MNQFQIQQQVLDLLKSHCSALPHTMSFQYKKQAIAIQVQAWRLLRCIKTQAKKAAIRTKWNDLCQSGCDSSMTRQTRLATNKEGDKTTFTM